MNSSGNRRGTPDPKPRQKTGRALLLAARDAASVEDAQEQAWLFRRFDRQATLLQRVLAIGHLGEMAQRGAEEVLSQPKPIELHQRS